VGSISVVREWSNWQAGFYWWIQSLYVSPIHRGRGVTALLMREVQEAARQENALDIRLYAHAGNIRAIRAYRKLGFEPSDYKIFKKDI
jgi:ribosomal protein S18 acetylase RimI-like enzyme